MLTGAAGLLLLGTAVVMMVCAAPRIQGIRTTSAQGRPVASHGHLASPGDRLAAWTWVTRGHQIRVTPAPVGEFARAGRGPMP